MGEAVANVTDASEQFWRCVLRKAHDALGAGREACDMADGQHCQATCIWVSFSGVMVRDFILKSRQTGVGSQDGGNLLRKDSLGGEGCCLLVFLD
ncbi:hypothetical protein Tco_0489406 [Tanacetum coccineum]